MARAPSPVDSTSHALACFMRDRKAVPFAMMSRPSISLAIRSLRATSSSSPAWTCRRCLATQSQSNTGSRVPSGPSDPATYNPQLPAAQRIDSDRKPYSLTATDRILKKAFTKHDIPVAYLQHVTSPLLSPHENAQRERTKKHDRIVGVVVSSGKMDKTVRVRVAGQTWHEHIGKYFRSHKNHLVHDPNNSLLTGDVVELHRLRVSARVFHVVASIISPFEKAIDARPPIPSPEERLASYKTKRFAKLNRRELRRKAADGDADAIKSLRDLGLDPGAGAVAGVERLENVQSGDGKGTGAVLGNKGQQLPKGILPGGSREFGKIGDRAQGNKGKTMKLEEKAVRNLEEADQVRVEDAVDAAGRV